MGTVKLIMILKKIFAYIIKGVPSREAPLLRERNLMVREIRKNIYRSKF